MFKSFEITANYLDSQETRQVMVNAANPEAAAKLAIIQRLLPVDFMANKEPKYWIDAGYSLEILKSEPSDGGKHIEISCSQKNYSAIINLNVQEKSLMGMFNIPLPER